MGPRSQAYEGGNGATVEVPKFWQEGEHNCGDHGPNARHRLQGQRFAFQRRFVAYKFGDFLFQPFDFVVQPTQVPFEAFEHISTQMLLTVRFCRSLRRQVGATLNQCT